MRKRYPLAALLILVAVMVLAAAFAATAFALPTFTQAVGSVGPCDSAGCHTMAATHAISFHSFACSTCHTVNTDTPPTPTTCATDPGCHGAASVILAAHAAAPAPGQGCTTTPGCHGVAAGAVITSITPSHSLAGAAVTIAGSGFGATQGTGTVMFGTTAAAVTSWSDTSIAVTVPATLSPGSVQVTVTPDGGSASAPFSFKVDLQATKVTLKLSGLTLGVLKRGKVVTATGRVTPLRAGQVTMILQKKKAGKWVRLKLVPRTMSATGTYTWRYRAGTALSARGYYRMRARTAETELYAKGLSVWRTFRVR